MSNFLKGNFKTKRTVQKKRQETENQIEAKFERTALKRLGGSIAFVSRKGFLWKGKKSDSKNPWNSSGTKSD